MTHLTGLEGFVFAGRRLHYVIAHVGRRSVRTIDVTVRSRTDTVHMLALFHVLDNVLLLLLLLLLLLMVVMLMLLQLNVPSSRESITIDPDPPKKQD